MNVVRSENGKRVLSVEKWHKCSLTSLDWVDIAVSTNYQTLNLLAKGQLLDSLILPMIPHEHTDKKTIMKVYFLQDLIHKKNIHKQQSL